MVWVGLDWFRAAISMFTVGWVRKVMVYKKLQCITEGWVGSSSLLLSWVELDLNHVGLGFKKWTHIYFRNIYIYNAYISTCLRTINIYVYKILYDFQESSESSKVRSEELS